jgi:hypothetical protein
VSARSRVADAAGCGAKFVKTTRNGWIDAAKRLKKLERRVGGGGRNIGLGASVVKYATNPGARYSGLERRDLRREDTTPSRRRKTTTTAT